MNKLDKTYTDLLQDILDNGVQKKDRTGTGTISVFGRQIRHNMKDGFPLLTTKKMPFKTIVTELLWFLRGDTNIKYLVDNNCHIWDGDCFKNFEKNYTPSDLVEKFDDSGERFLTLLTQEEFINKIKTNDEFVKKWGDLGPIYGKQWRGWNGIDKESFFNSDNLDERNRDARHGMFYKESEIDQIQNLINDLKTNPDSRRLMVNAWNVGEIDQMVLPPCHYGFQLYTRELSLEEKECQLEKTNCINDIENDRIIYGHDWEKYIQEQYEGIQSNQGIDIPTRAISLMWNQRSVDTFLGLPFNIASYGLLLEIIAKEVNMVPDELIGNLGDVHLYSNHIEQAKEQIGRRYTHEERIEMLRQAMGEESYQIALDQQVPFGGGLSEYFLSYGISYFSRTREPFPLPTLKFNPCPITGISMEYQSISQFEIENYQSHPTIKAPLSN